MFEIEPGGDISLVGKECGGFGLDPIKGAVEKYASVLAAPISRRARTNRTKLNP
jgi:hypothetical protein